MGIKNYQQYIKTTYSKACKTKWEGVIYDNLYIDLNHVLHHVCYLSKNTQDLSNRYMDYLRNILYLVRPAKRLYIGADGPAPMAKMLLQRKRRLDMIKSTPGEVDMKKNLNLNLTPGTEFMMNLEDAMQNFITYVKKTFKIEVIVSVTDADEGEIKIKQILQKIQKKHPSDTHIVFSGDSDVILLLFACKDLDKIYHMIQKDTIIHFGTMLTIHRELFGKTDSDQLDFVFINLMMGNDYLPKTSYFKLENIWDAYKIVARSRPKGLIKLENDKITIDHMFLMKLIFIGTKNSPVHFMNRFKITDLKDQHYDNYVIGMYWCFSMYTIGSCSDYRYQYDHNVSPHIMGVALSLMKNREYTIIHSESIDVDLYGILLIPEKVNMLLSKEQNMIAEKLVEKHPVIYEEGRCDKCKKYAQILSKIKKEIKEDDESPRSSKKVGDLNRKFSVHREKHEKLTFKKIDEITKDFVLIRDELRETVSLDDSCDSAKSSHVYQPPTQRRKMNTKNIFKKRPIIQQ